MTKKQYLKAIENNIQSLTLEEQKEALQFYSDYFDEADDDEKVMEELGTPEEVASKIIEKMANVPVSYKKEESKEDEDNTINNSDNFDTDALFYSFDQKEVKNFDLGFGACEVIAIPGNKISVETRGISRQNLNCKIDSNGTLCIRNVKKINVLNFFNHDRPSRIVPRILITIPDNLKLNYFKLNFGAGRFEAKNVNFSFEAGNIEVGAGNLILSCVQGRDVIVRCGMGNLEVSGQLHGRVNVDCGMGSIKLNLKQNEEDCSYDAKVGLGSFRFNSKVKSGITQIYAENRKEDHFSVNTGMGSVSINTK